MAKDQTSVIDLLPLLESTDLQQLQQTRQLVEDHLRAGTYQHTHFFLSLTDTHIQTQINSNVSFTNI